MVGRLNSSTMRDATIPITPGCQLSDERTRPNRPSFTCPSIRPCAPASIPRSRPCPARSAPSHPPPPVVEHVVDPDHAPVPCSQVHRGIALRQRRHDVDRFVGGIEGRRRTIVEVVQVRRRFAGEGRDPVGAYGPGWPGDDVGIPARAGGDLAVPRAAAREEGAARLRGAGRRAVSSV